jgi:outer membrane protein assembly factor BamD
LTSSHQTWRAVACVALVMLSGCSLLHRHREDKLAKQSPDALYKAAHKQMVSYDFKSAIKSYEGLTARYPFTDPARQSRLDLIYVYYKEGERESALDAADQFIRENPTHPRVDYAWYVKGLIDFEHPPNFLEKIFHADLSQRSPSNARKSFDAFRTVVEQYPKSIYAYDARQRMVFLRNRLADYEVNVAGYYMRRGAYVGAAQRARETIEQYDGAPAVRKALQILVAANDQLALQPLAEQARQVYAFNFPAGEQPAPEGKKKSWWHFW